MRVLGVDLAAQTDKTGVILLEVPAAGLPKATLINERASDDVLVRWARQVDYVGVDAPLGWPVNFVAAVSAHERLEPWLGRVDRTDLCFRRTDYEVRAITGRWPLSVSADKLGIVAMRCALLQERFAQEAWGGPREPRDGSGRLVETYPAAALQLLGLPSRSYKGDGEERRAARGQIVEGLGRLVELTSAATVCVADDNTLDAVLAAWVAWKAAERRTISPSDDEDRRLALVEGWIHLPRA
jgi:predicted nuclease with RNAse H fold